MSGRIQAVAAIVVAIIGVLVFAGLRPHPGKPAAPPPGVWLQGTQDCAFKAVGADVQVEATGQAGCAQVQQTLDEADGLAWQQEPALTPVSASGAAVYETCSVVSAPMRVTVEDSASGGYGTGLCDDARQQGWQTASANT